jgi:hypothetical protein
MLSRPPIEAGGGLPAKSLYPRPVNKREPAPHHTDEFVYVYLDDAHLRQEDHDYARIQRERLRNWLIASEIVSR